WNRNPQPTSFTESHDAFTIGMANVIASKKMGNVGFTVDLAVGPRAETANGYSGTTLSAIKQLFVTYSPIEPLTFTLGNFSTFIGYELINPGDNIHYSTSYLFSNGPFYHTGLSATYAFNNSLSLLIGVFNDTDEKIDVNKGKHLGTQLAYTKDRGSLFLNYLTGRDNDEPDQEIIGHQFDLTGSLDLLDQWGLGLNLSYKYNQSNNNTDQNWFGAAIYTRYELNQLLTLGLRGEYLSDPDEIIFETRDARIFAFTFSANIRYKGLTLLPEFRIDLSDQALFLDQDNLPVKSSPSILSALIYTF
ncbi:MAG: porin, partial [Bacteroidota bacterium]